MPDSTPPEPNLISAKMLDSKIPLVWLIGVAVSIVSSYAILYTDVNRMRSDMADLKTTIKASDTGLVTVQGQLAIMQFRMEATERELQRLKEARK